jgi:hypothetical protein
MEPERRRSMTETFTGWDLADTYFLPYLLEDDAEIRWDEDRMDRIANW